MTARTVQENYAEVGVRYLTYSVPSNYDAWGTDAQGNVWQHSFCVQDDFGNAVPVECCGPYEEGCVQIWAPEFGTHGTYRLHTPLVH